MLRRIERHEVVVGDEAWLESDIEGGSAEPRIVPTALLALARIAMGERARALPLIRSIAVVARGAGDWDGRARAMASAAAARLATGLGRELAPGAIVVDGRPISAEIRGGVALAEVAGLAAPGSHTIEITLPEGAVALASLEVTYRLPWNVPPRRSGALELSWSGEAGARETRSALLLRAHNRGARVLARPILEIELPAGAELDEPTRVALGASLAGPAELDGNTLRLRLRPLAPGGFVEVPLRARWSVGGTLRGLGVQAYDAASPPRADARIHDIVPSREVTLPDSGPEPEPPEADASDPPRPRPPIPIPLPRPLAEVLR